jgi:alkylation response protein AidB-like acyl-CoA dehydrogenase
MAVPKELGGLGMTLAEVCQEQRRLAYHAHATALGINLHLYWTELAADLWRSGDTSCEWLLKELLRVRSLQRDTPKVAMTFRDCCPRPKPSALTVDTALPVTNLLAV